MSQTSELRTAATVAPRTSTFDALGHVFAVQCDESALLSLVERAFGALAVTGDPLGTYSVVRVGDRYDLTWRGEPVIAGADRAGLLDWLQWDVNRRAIAAADAELVLHAGCVARDGHAVVVSGASGSGKSTLVAALVSQGLDYLTDEAVPVGLADGHVRAFPRPIALDDHSLDLLPEVAPLRAAPGDIDHKRMVVMPSPINGNAPPLGVTLVVFPERDDSGLTVLEPISRGDAVVRLAENAFNFPSHGRDGIDALALLVHEADSYRVVGGDPRTAASAVIGALDQFFVSHPGQGWRKVS